MDQTEYGVLLAFCCNRIYPPLYNKNERDCLRKRAKSFVVKEGVLFYRDKEGGDFQVVTEKNKQNVLEGCELGGGHFGRDKTLSKIAERFYWRGMVDDVKEFRKTCDKCQRANRLSQVKKPNKVLAQKFNISRLKLYHQNAPKNELDKISKSLDLKTDIASKVSENAEDRSLCSMPEDAVDERDGCVSEDSSYKNIESDNFDETECKTETQQSKADEIQCKERGVLSPEQVEVEAELDRSVLEEQLYSQALVICGGLVLAYCIMKPKRMIKTLMYM
ncbi:hypothetical protein EMCRGX_G003909 [Ephydatia muelleri]